MTFRRNQFCTQLDVSQLLQTAQLPTLHLLRSSHSALSFSSPSAYSQLCLSAHFQLTVSSVFQLTLSSVFQLTFSLLAALSFSSHSALSLSSLSAHSQFFLSAHFQLTLSSVSPDSFRFLWKETASITYRSFTYKNSSFVQKQVSPPNISYLSESQDSSVSIVTRLGLSSILGTHREVCWWGRTCLQLSSNWVFLLGNKTTVT